MPNTDKTILLPQLQRYDQKIKGWADAKFLTKVDTPSLPKATATTLGGVKVGNGLNVTDDGTLSVETHSNETSITTSITATYYYNTETWDTVCKDTYDVIVSLFDNYDRVFAWVNSSVNSQRPFPQVFVELIKTQEGPIVSTPFTIQYVAPSKKLSFKTGLTTTSSCQIYFNANGSIDFQESYSKVDQYADGSEFKNEVNGSIAMLTLKDGGITGAKIKDSAITSAKIAMNAVTALEIKDDEIDEQKIKANAITRNKIKNGAISSDKLALGAVLTEHIRENTIVSGHITDGAVKSSKIADDAVTVTKIASRAVTTDKIADGAVTREKIADGAINAPKLWTGAVHTDKILDRAVTAAKLASGSVTVEKIADGAIIAEKLASESVTANKIAYNTITSANLASGSVTTNKIADGAITKDKLASDVGAGGGGEAEIAFVTKEGTSTNVVLQDGNSIRFIAGDFYCYIINYHIKSSKNFSTLNWQMKDADGNYILPWWMVTETNFRNVSPMASLGGIEDYRTIMGFVPRAKSAKAALATLLPVQDECEQMEAEVAKLEQDWIDNQDETVAVDGNGVPITIVTKKTELDKKKEEIEKKKAELEKLREDYFSKLGDWKNEVQE